MKMAKEVELTNYRWWDEPEGVNDTAVIPISNKRYIKIDEYETLLAKENSTESIKYKERLIDYEDDDLYLGWDRSEIFY